jgi:RNA polymerase sigma-70 factor (ECF subfamily)
LEAARTIKTRFAVAAPTLEKSEPAPGAFGAPQETTIPEDLPKDAQNSAAEISIVTRQMANGDELAYRRFYDGYFPRLLGYLLVLTRGREDVARDALQCTLIRVVRHVKPFQSEAAFWSWLTVLARSSVVDEQRKRTRYRGLLDRLFQRVPVINLPTETDLDEDLIAALELNLAQLPSGDRELIERKYYARQSVKEMAAALQLSEKAIELRLVRARRKLKDLVMAGLNHEK